MYVLDKESNKPLYLQLYEAMKKEIVTTLKYGDKLPSIRNVASQYSISKNTAELAYKQLYTEGYIESAPQSGYFVADMPLEQDPPIKTIYMLNTKTSPSIRYDFIPARLTPDAFPLKLWKRLFIKAMGAELDFGAYGDRQGEIGLREEIARYLMQSRGVNCDAGHVIICGGFADSMHILATLLKKQCSHIAIEHPGFPIVRSLFNDYGYTTVPIHVDQDGLVIDELEVSPSNLVYITPSHQYPTGVSMPIRNRIRLLNWSKQIGGIIIEDDYDSELRYQNRPIPSLQGLDKDDRVIYVGTFSKSLSPALRVSYLVLPHRYLDKYKMLFLTRHQRCSVSLSTQKTLELFMAGGHWERHLRKIRTLNRKKHDVMKETLQKTFGSMIEIISEGGGLAILMRPTHTINLNVLRQNALEKGIKLYLASDYYGNDWEAIRMGFGGLSETEIREGVALLKEVWMNTLEKKDQN
ncbi:PLP-dependent aminotransferase family protein [Sulfurospirillum diekertiae]|uniref:PLP-dependent aminotransferase family protein n=1 Tax=Sulfurospirillum diekertiae TaxID=1854492 RepID=A0A6G9VUF7_9BACT|nr:PLP-dependent aminotransferase family protein [Sulfurospirillum diekertiae]QIR77024.1 PLP-dependent aminotransferase family protein [Sulfurospirillum diekertiae]QIR79639.1 PLP-dependent aminotransferase family protein [Sulfurospirillum diekertiae]